MLNINTKLFNPQNAYGNGNWYYGADVEFFLKEGNNIISSKVLEKNNKFRLSYNGIIERDGVPIEYQMTQGRCLASGLSAIKSSLVSFMEYLYNTNKNYSLSSNNFTLMNLEELKNNEDHKALEFGCMPDFNAYFNIDTIDNSNKKADAKIVAARTCGGHIHANLFSEYCKYNKVFEGNNNLPIIFKTISVDNKYIYIPTNDYQKKYIQNIVAWLDLVVGLWSVIVDEPSMRRLYYGKAGDFRTKPYGIEYRSIGNILMLSPILWRTFMSLTRCVIVGMEKTYNPDDETLMLSPENLIPNYNPEEIQNIINNSSQEDAFKYWIFKVYPALINHFNYCKNKGTLYAKDVDKLIEPINTENILSLIMLTTIFNVVKTPYRFFYDNPMLNWGIFTEKEKELLLTHTTNYSQNQSCTVFSDQRYNTGFLLRGYYILLKMIELLSEEECEQVYKKLEIIMPIYNELKMELNKCKPIKAIEILKDTYFKDEPTLFKDKLNQILHLKLVVGCCEIIKTNEGLRFSSIYDIESFINNSIKNIKKSYAIIIKQ
jgi:hypothetical protein